MEFIRNEDINYVSSNFIILTISLPTFRNLTWPRLSLK